MNEKINLSMITNVLYDQINKINDNKLRGENLENQLKKSAAIVVLSKTIIETNRLALDAMKAQSDLIESVNLPRALMLDND